jgi:hypothetical protein
VKPVSPHAFVGKPPRQCEGLRGGGLCMVKGRIEAGNLRKRRRHLRHSLDGRNVVRLVQRRQRHQRFQLRQYCCIDHARGRQVCPSMHDPMANRTDAVTAEHT